MKKNKSDDVLKEYWSDKRRFADLFNGLLFDGRQVIQTEDLIDSDTALATTVVDKKNDMYSATRYADVVKTVRNQFTLAILGVENQDSIHYAMPIRIMLQHALGYVRQCKDIQSEHRSKSKRYGNSAVYANGDEYLSGMKNTDRVLPIITIVLYYGEKEWDGPISLSDMIDNKDLYGSFFCDYRMNLIWARNCEDLQRFHTEIGQFFGLMKVLKSKESLEMYLSGHSDEELDQDTARAAAVAVKSERMLKMMSEAKKEEVISMCTALEELIEEREARGEARGEAKAIIRLCQKFQLSREETIVNLREEMDISETEAWAYMNKSENGEL